MKRVVDARAVSQWTQRAPAAAKHLLLKCLLSPAVVVSRGTVDAVWRVVDADADGSGVVVLGCSCNRLEGAVGVQRTYPPAARTARNWTDSLDWVADQQHSKGTRRVYRS
jgi:hypothetical protein